MEKSISVVIPVHNAEHSLKECLDSLFKSSYENFEVIIVNDFSTDESIKIAKEYPCKITNLSEQRGPAFARDRGIILAEGEIVAFLDSDCIVPKDWLNKINTKLTHDIVGIGGKYNLPKNINFISSLFMTYWDLKNIFYIKPRSLISLSGGNCAFWKAALMQKRKKKELVYCNRGVGGDDTIMCCELREFGKLIYDPDLFIEHNKRCTLLGILKETSVLGYRGAIVTRLCGDLLIKESHRLYKAILYLLSVFIFLLTFLLPLIRVWPVYVGLVIFYVVAQLPIILLTYKYLSKRIYVLLLPVIVFVADIFYFIGHIKRGWSIIRKKVESAIWYARFIANAINPLALSRIFFFVTKKCNADCYFCFNKKDRQMYQKEDNLSLQEIKNITSKMGFLPWLTITGGEPFLRIELYEICKLFYHNCDTRIISVVTNGMLPLRVEETVEKLLIDCEELKLTIIIALDDVGDRHDRIKGVKNSYKQALDTLEKLNDLRLRFPRLTLAINTLLVKENADHIEEILGYFSNNLKYDRQYLNLLRQPACTSIDPELISIQKYFDLVTTRTFNRKAIDAPYSIKQRFNQALLEYSCKKSLEEFKLKRSLGICLAVQKFFVINSDGTVFPCELLMDELGNFRKEEYDFRKIVKGPKTKKIKLKIRNTNCYCQWPCAIGINSYYKISSYPKILKNIIYSK